MELKIADRRDLDTLVPLVSAYHRFERVRTTTSADIARTLDPLLDPGANLGRIWLICHENQIVGYIALCFGYSIEFGGRDAFIDEFFIVESMRRKGMGSQVLESVKHEAARLGIMALHLEVAEENTIAKDMYSRHGFQLRDRYHLMSCRLT